jgi:parvulin-like peptidyl-prolyl isomerase
VVSYSAEESSRALAGDIGWVTQGDGTLPLSVEEAAFAITRTSDLSPVVEDDLGYYIVQVVERDEAANRVHLRLALVKRADKLIQEVYDYVVSGDTNTMVDRFRQMATKYSDDTESNSKMGDLGWFGRGKTANTMEIEDRAFAMEVDQVSEPFEGTSGWHVILVRGHDMNHPIDQATLDQQAQEAFEDWKAGLLEKAVVVRYPPSTPTPTPTPPPFVPTVEPTAAPITGTVTISGTVTP